MKFPSSHSRRKFRLPVRDGNTRVKQAPTQQLQHGNDRLPKKRKERK